MFIGICRGLISTFLKWANITSQTQESYECGPVKQKGIFNSSSSLSVEAHVCAGQLSAYMTVFSLQFFLSESSFLTRSLKKISMVFALVFACNKDK